MSYRKNCVGQWMRSLFRVSAEQPPMLSRAISTFGTEVVVCGRFLHPGLQPPFVALPGAIDIRRLQRQVICSKISDFMTQEWFDFRSAFKPIK